MADRHCLGDSCRDTQDIFGVRYIIFRRGISGSDLSREIAGTDKLKRATERPACATGVIKSDKTGKDIA